MQTFKDKQQDLFKWEHLPDKTLSWLQINWPGVWRREVIALIDEAAFSDLYCAHDGRASKATADMVGILILKEMEDLTDEETAQRVMLDVGWQYALDMAPAEAYVAVRTLQYFRANVIRSRKHKALFARITDRIIATMNIGHTLQRKDSTHILSNMARLTRLGLFTQTITLFLNQLRKREPKKYDNLDLDIRHRYTERKSGTFADARGSESHRRLDQCAADAWLLLERFKKSKNARALDGYQLLRRLFNEQCKIETGDTIVLRKDVPVHSLQSPHDPDAGYSGHKGKGYQAQLTETCDPANPMQAITHVAVESAAESDAESPVRDTEELEPRRLKPEELQCDTAYNGGDNDVALRDMGVELIGPAAGKEPAAGTAAIGRFETTFNLKEITHCPRGITPLHTNYDPDWDTVAALFDKDTCAHCDLRNICGVKRHKQGYALNYARRAMATSKRRLTEQTEQYKARYALRAGIEATNSELKRAHGMGRLRVRGRPAVEFAIFMKTTACNIKRMLRLRVEQARNAARDENAAACAVSQPQNALAAALGRFRLLASRLSARSWRFAA